MEGSVLFSLEFQNVGVGRRICHFRSFSMRVLARGMDAGGGGRRPFHNEVAGGSEGQRRTSLPRQVHRLQWKCCRVVQAGSLMNHSVLFSLEGLALRYPPSRAVQAGSLMDDSVLFSLEGSAAR